MGETAKREAGEVGKGLDTDREPLAPPPTFKPLFRCLLLPGDTRIELSWWRTGVDSTREDTNGRPTDAGDDRSERRLASLWTPVEHSAAPTLSRKGRGSANRERDGVLCEWRRASTWAALSPLSMDRVVVGESSVKNGTGVAQLPPPLYVVQPTSAAHLEPATQSLAEAAAVVPPPPIALGYAWGAEADGSFINVGLETGDPLKPWGRDVLLLLLNK
jgi:hypothetical protein